MTSPTAQSLPDSVCETLLQLAPVNVFFFDTELVCRYAAPVGDEFLGLHRDLMPGRPAAEILPPAANGLRREMERAALQATSWHNPEYHFVHHAAGQETPCCWTIHIEPVTVESFRGVMVSWSDVKERADERESLRADLEEQRQANVERDSALMALLSDLRNMITPISGYLQVIARRPAMLGRRSVTDVISFNILPRVNDVLASLDRLRRAPIYSGVTDT